MSVDSPDESDNSTSPNSASPTPAANVAYSAATGYDLAPDDSALSALLQMQRRLLFLGSQIDGIQQQISQIMATVGQERDQLDGLLRHLADSAQAENPPQDRIVEFSEQLSVHHDQLSYLGRKLTELATQEQLVRRATLVASQQQVVELTEAVRELSRAQQRTNELTDSRGRQVNDILSTMQNLLNRRSRLEEQQIITTPEQLDGLRAEGRGEFAATFLPAIDGLERVLEEGRLLLARHRQEIVDAAQSPTAAGGPADARPGDKQAASGSLVNRLRSRLAGENDPDMPLPAPTSTSTPMSTPTSMPTVPDPMIAKSLHEWLRALALMRDRFLMLLASEGIQPIPTVRHPFDPMLHLAVQSETRNDLPANTIVREMRRGFRQGTRVLRYAEVVVARPS